MFDDTIKVGSALHSNATHRFVCGLSGPNAGGSDANKLHCAHSTNSSSYSWAGSSPATGTQYVESGVYLVPDSGFTGGVTYGFLVTSNGSGQDRIERYYLQVNGGSLSVSGVGTHDPSGIDRLGPRLALAVSDEDNDPVYAFTVVPSSDGTSGNRGKLVALRSTQYGADSPTWVDVSGELSHNFDDTGTPIAAVRSYVFDYLPLVAIRENPYRLALVYFDGTDWHYVTTDPLPDDEEIGNSIAIARTVPFTESGYEKYERIVAAAADRHLYETRIRRNLGNNTISADPWIDLGELEDLDYLTDSLAADWYNDGSEDWLTVYARKAIALDPTAWTADFDTSGAISNAGWLDMTVDNQGNWGASDKFLGQQFVFRWDNIGNKIHDVYGLCTHSSVTAICKMGRTAGSGNFSWIFP